MKIYFDSEFTGLRKDTTLISIGLIDENNRMFYGVCNDYDRSQINDWLINNVIKKLDYDVPDSLKDSEMVYFNGTKDEVKEALLEWMSNGEYKTVEFVSDVCHYDFVLLIDLLWGDALNMPENISPVCTDLNSYIARLKKIMEQGAFNISREDLLSQLKAKYNTTLIEEVEKMETKHNALYDAIVIKLLYNAIESECGEFEF